MNKETNFAETSKKKLVGEYVIKSETNYFPFKYRLYKKEYNEYGVDLTFIDYCITLASAKRKVKKIAKRNLFNKTNININVYINEHDKLIVE